MNFSSQQLEDQRSQSFVRESIIMEDYFANQQNAFIKVEEPQPQSCVLSQADRIRQEMEMHNQLMKQK